jgi:hypothetical protein
MGTAQYPRTAGAVKWARTQSRGVWARGGRGRWSFGRQYTGLRPSDQRPVDIPPFGWHSSAQSILMFRRAVSRWESQNSKTKVSSAGSRNWTTGGARRALPRPARNTISCTDLPSTRLGGSQAADSDWDLVRSHGCRACYDLVGLRGQSRPGDGSETGTATEATFLVRAFPGSGSGFINEPLRSLRCGRPAEV